VEEKILALQDRKKDLAAQMLAGDKLEASLTEEDFTALLSLK
jgi:SNF2 family DNA or RNA helicase